MIVDRCKRSTLMETEDGRLYRRYHDTNAISTTFPAHIDASGIRRCSGNRRIDTLRDESYRGASTQRPRSTPPHLQNTLAIVCRKPRDIQVVALHLNVAVNTAWSYVCRVVETWPTSYDLASALVDADMTACVSNEENLSGSLRDLMMRLPPRAYHALREADDRYAHLRLARICEEVRREQNKIMTV